MLELKLAKDSPFFKILEAILDLVDVARFDFSCDGLLLQAANIVTISLNFPANDFKAYKCDNFVSMGIDIRDMIKTVRCANENDIITIQIGDEDMFTINISFESPRKENIMDFDFRILDPSIDCFLMEDITCYDAYVEMPSVEFMHICEYITSVANVGDISVTGISLSPDILSFFVLGIKGCLKFNCTKYDTIVVAESATIVSLSFDLKYMNSIVKIAKACVLCDDQVKIGLSKMQCMMVKCRVGNKGSIEYFLAPKVEKTEEER